MASNRHPVELNFDAQCVQCGALAAHGARRCRRHLARQEGSTRGFWRKGKLDMLLRPSSHPRPDWMLDPTLLPKFPPGRVAA